MKPRHLASLAFAALAAGCASTPTLDAQWMDTQAPAQPLRGQRVLVACEAFDTVIRRICQDQLAAEVTARGATPVLAPDIVPGPGTRVGDEAWLPAAREAGARAVLAATVSQADSAGGGYYGGGPSIGLGGFGGSRGGGVGVGISVPIGGGGAMAPATRYAATGRITDTASGRLLWTARASGAAGGDFGRQMGDLARAVLGAADKAGMF